LRPEGSQSQAEEHGNNDAGDVEIEATQAEASRHALDEEGHEQTAKEDFLDRAGA